MAKITVERVMSSGGADSGEKDFMRVAVELDVDSVLHKDIFRMIALVDEVKPTRCGHCGGNRIIAQVRSVSDGKYTYYEAECLACRYVFKYGQLAASGDLFPKGWFPPFDKSRGDSDNDPPF